MLVKILNAAAVVVYLFVALMACKLAAQELEPRAYSASPTGANFIVIGFATSSGSVVFDPSIPLTDVHASIHSPVLGIGRTFGIWGRQALVTAGLPYAFGGVEGKVGAQLQQASITRSGLADVRMRLSLNLRGSPALSVAEFSRNRRRTLLVGTSISVQAPSGQYIPTRLINLGTNRWAFKPELGLSYPLRNFYVDLYAGAWLFTQNSSFFPGDSVRRQNTLTALQAHVSYNLRQHLWFALDSTWYQGGSASINDGPPVGRQANSRLGVTCSLPLNRHQSLKIAYSNGVTARAGASFSTLSAAWQVLWFDRPRR